MQGGPERFFHSGFRQLLSGCQAKDKMGLCTGPAGGRRALGFVQDDRLTAAEMQEAGQFVRVGVARQPGGAAAHIQRQRWPGEEPARLALPKSASACGIVTPRQSFPRQALRNRCLWRGVLTCVIISVR